MRTILKYRIPLEGVMLPIPPTAEVVAVHDKHGQVHVWVDLDDEHQVEGIGRFFRIYGTGHPIHPKARIHGSAFCDGFVWHVAEEGKP